MTLRERHLLFWLVVSGGLNADILSKNWVFSFLSERLDRSCDLWPGVFRLSMHYNTGGPFSILSGHNPWLVAVTLVALGAIIYLYLGAAKSGRPFTLVALAMIAGGALGNLLDRAMIQRVRDFLDFYLIHYPVFNVADILITLGAALLVIELLRGEGRKVKPEPPRPPA